MADQKITELAELDATPDDADLLAIVDGGVTTKKITVANLKLAANKIGVVTADVTVANTTTETNLIQVSIPADRLGTGNVIMAKLFITNFGSVQPGSGSEDCTIRLKYGGTTIATAVAGNSVAEGSTVTDLSGIIEAVLVGSGATNSQEGVVLFSLGNKRIGYNANEAENTCNVVAGTAAEDSTGALNLTITIQWSSANAGNTITMSTAVVY